MSSQQGEVCAPDSVGLGLDINGPQMPARGGESGLLQEPQLVTLFSWVHQLYL